MTAVGLVCADLMVLLTRNDIGTAETIGRSALVSALTVAIFFLPVVRGYSRKQLWLYTVKQFTVFATAEFIGISALHSGCNNLEYNQVAILRF